MWLYFTTGPATVSFVRRSGLSLNEPFGGFMLIRVLTLCTCCLRAFAPKLINSNGECAKCEQEIKEFMEEWKNQEIDPEDNKRLSDLEFWS